MFIIEKERMKDKPKDFEILIDRPEIIFLLNNHNFFMPQLKRNR
jgi:hypothetical protein